MFACRKQLGEVVVKGELAASTAILAAGFNLDCLLLRYQVRPPSLCSPSHLLCCLQSFHAA